MKVTRAEFRKILKAELPNAHCSVADGLGTKVSKPYIDVSLPTEDLSKLDAICKRIGVRNCGGIGVVPYHGSFRRIDLSGVA